LSLCSVYRFETVNHQHREEPGMGTLLGAPDRGAPATTISRYFVPEIVFGSGALAEAGRATRRLGARRAFLVTDPGIIDAGWTAAVHEHLEQSGLAYVTWDAVSPNPKDHEIARALEAYRATDCDVIIGLGGGSPMDAAKAVAVLSANGGDILDYQGFGKVARPIPPLVMIPTTAGSGADVSQFCVITDTARKLKATVLGCAVVPDISLIDPLVLLTMPRWLTAVSGIDALTMAIEAYLSPAASTLTGPHALVAIQLIRTHLVRALDAPRDEGARAALAAASLHAGMAFSNTLPGVTHALSHPLGGLLDLPHGVIAGVLLPQVIRYNSTTDPTRFVSIATAVGLDTTGTSGRCAARAVADWVRALADKVDIPRGLSDLGIEPDDIPSLALAAMDDVDTWTNPHGVSLEELAGILHAAL
jgi:alcohol dehydrogenase